VNLIPPWLHQDAKRRLGVAMSVGGLLFLVLPPWIHLETRIVMAWDGLLITFLLLAWSVIGTATATETSQRTIDYDQSGPVILALVVTAMCASLFAVAFMLGTTKNLTALPLLGHVLCSVIAVVGAWLLIHTMFTLHYAQGYYREKGCLDFPGDTEPDYLDFAYFAFVIGMTSQVSDVAIQSRWMRRLALWHGLISFAFNTVILALSINLLAGLVH